MLESAEKVGSRRLLAAAYGRSIFFQDYRLTNGTTEPFLLSESAATPVIGMAVTAQNEVILVRNFRPGVDSFVEEFPGGCLKAGQSLEEAMRQELLEETGYVCASILRLSDPIAFDPAWYNVRFTPFLMTGCVYIQPPQLDPTERLEVFTLPLFEFYEQIFFGQLARDAKTLATALLALRHLHIGPF